MGKFVIEAVFMAAFFGLGYWFAVTKYFGEEAINKTVRVGDKFFRVTKLKMSETEAE